MMTAAAETAALALDAAILAGEWTNTNAEAGIARIVCTSQPDGTMRVRCTGRGTGGEMQEWGEVDAPLYSFTFESRQAGAFSAVFDLGYEEVRMQANVKAGVLVVASFNRFKDDSGRSNYFDREFFHRISKG
jgi:hypothetical protein